jgi:hypothetical protein
MSGRNGVSRVKNATFSLFRPAFLETLKRPYIIYGKVVKRRALADMDKASRGAIPPF